MQQFFNRSDHNEQPIKSIVFNYLCKNTSDHRVFQEAVETASNIVMPTIFTMMNHGVCSKIVELSPQFIVVKHYQTPITTALAVYPVIDYKHEDNAFVNHVIPGSCQVDPDEQEGYCFLFLHNGRAGIAHQTGD